MCHLIVSRVFKLKVMGWSFWYWDMGVSLWFILWLWCHVIDSWANWHYLPKNAFISSFIGNVLRCNKILYELKLPQPKRWKQEHWYYYWQWEEQTCFATKNCWDEDMELNTIQNHFNILELPPLFISCQIWQKYSTFEKE